MQAKNTAGTIGEGSGTYHRGVMTAFFCLAVFYSSDRIPHGFRPIGGVFFATEREGGEVGEGGGRWGVIRIFNIYTYLRLCHNFWGLLLFCYMNRFH